MYFYTKIKKQYFKGHLDLNLSFLINIHRSGKQIDMAVCLSSFCREKLEPPYGTHLITFKGKNIC